MKLTNAILVAIARKGVASAIAMATAASERATDLPRSLRCSLLFYQRFRARCRPRNTTIQYPGQQQRRAAQADRRAAQQCYCIVPQQRLAQTPAHLPVQCGRRVRALVDRHTHPCGVVNGAVVEDLDGTWALHPDCVRSLQFWRRETQGETHVHRDGGGGRCRAAGMVDHLRWGR